MRKLAATSLALLALAPGRLFADAASEAEREQLRQVYASQLQNSPSIFDTAPVYHIIPVENTISFAAAYNYYDVTIAPPGSDISTNRNQLSQRLDMTGWSASPYVAFSTKNFGFGFTGEIGQRSAHFLQLPQAESQSTSGERTPAVSYAEQFGTINYSGVGLNLFWTPSWRLIPKFASLTFIAGGKSLNVVAETSGTMTDQYSPITMTKYNYAVQSYEAGCNIGLHLIKHFTVIPWVDFSTNLVSTPKLANGEPTPTASPNVNSGSSPNGNAATPDPAVNDDAALFWKTAPSLTYGIDFVVKLYGFDIHLGGLIGILGTLNKGSGQIQDDSRTVSVSFDTKGG